MCATANKHVAAIVKKRLRFAIEGVKLRGVYDASHFSLLDSMKFEGSIISVDTSPGSVTTHEYFIHKVKNPRGADEIRVIPFMTLLKMHPLSEEELQVLMDYVYDNESNTPIEEAIRFMKL